MTKKLENSGTVIRIFKKIKAGFNEFGEQLADKRKIAIPAGMERPESLEEQMMRMVRSTISRQMQDQGHDTFEEYDDFEEEDSSWDTHFVVKYVEDGPDYQEAMQKAFKAPSASPAEGVKGESKPPLEESVKKKNADSKANPSDESEED